MRNNVLFIILYATLAQVLVYGSDDDSKFGKKWKPSGYFGFSLEEKDSFEDDRSDKVSSKQDNLLKEPESKFDDEINNDEKITDSDEEFSDEEAENVESDNAYYNNENKTKLKINENKKHRKSKKHKKFKNKKIKSERVSNQFVEKQESKEIKKTNFVYIDIKNKDLLEAVRKYNEYDNDFDKNAKTLNKRYREFSSEQKYNWWVKQFDPAELSRQLICSKVVSYLTFLTEQLEKSKGKLVADKGKSEKIKNEVTKFFSDKTLQLELAGVLKIAERGQSLEDDAAAFSKNNKKKQMAKVAIITEELLDKYDLLRRNARAKYPKLVSEFLPRLEDLCLQ